MKLIEKRLPSISAEEMQSRCQTYEASRHSLALEGSDTFLDPEAEALSEAWIGGEITLEAAIEQTLQNICANYVGKTSDFAQ